MTKRSECEKAYTTTQQSYNHHFHCNWIFWYRLPRYHRVPGSGGKTSGKYFKPVQ